MKFEGCVEIETQVAKKACENYKQAKEAIEILVEDLIEEYKTTIIPYTLFGFEIPFIKTTLYKSFGSRNDVFDNSIANIVMFKYLRKTAKYNNKVKDNPEEIAYLISKYYTDDYNFEYRNYFQLKHLIGIGVHTITINPSQAKFVNYWLYR